MHAARGAGPQHAAANMMMPPWCLPQVGYKIGSADTVQLGDVIPNLKEFTEGAFLPASAARVVLAAFIRGGLGCSKSRPADVPRRDHARFAKVA